MTGLSGLTFMIGQVEVNLQMVNLERMTANVDVNIPVMGNTLQFSFSSGIGWRENRNLNFHVHYTTKGKEEEDTIPFEGNDEEEEDGS